MYEAMSFKKLDGGQEATSDFYIKNTSMGVVEDLEVHVESVSKKDVSVVLLSSSLVESVASQGIYHGCLRWRAREGGKAEPCLVRVGIKGMLTQEM